MSRRRRGRGQSEILRWVAGAALLALATIAIAVGAYFKFTTPGPVKLAADLCPETGPTAITVILLDASDEWPDITKSDALNVMRDVARAVEKHELIEFRVLDPSIAGGRTLFSKCNPGDGSDLNDMTANTEKARRRWQAQFQQPLENLLQRLETNPAEISPIASTLQRIAVDRFSDGSAKEAPKNLVVVSDMIEHTPVYSQYKGDLSYERFRKTDAYKKLRTDLHGAVVSIFYVQRLKPALDSGAHISFWQEWIKDNHGQQGRARKLQGAG